MRKIMKLTYLFVLTFILLTSYGQVELVIPIIEGTDDAEQIKIDMQLNSDVITIGKINGNNYVAGFRYQNVTIPKGAEINTAYIQFSSASENFNNSILINGQKIADAPTFTDDPGNISTRAKTEAEVSWETGYWEDNEQSAKQQTPALNAIIQEIIDLDDWSSGNSMVFIVSVVSSSGINVLKVDAFEELGEVLSATLNLTYTAPDGVAEENAAFKLSVYPNPVEDAFSVSFFNQSAENCSISLVDITGKALVKIYEGQLNQGQQQFLLSAKELNLKSGIYFISFQNDKGTANKKLILQ